MKTPNIIASTLFFFLFTGLSSSIKAQVNFVHGEMYDYSGDTLRGYINLGSADDLASFCLFKPQLDDQSKEYHPADIMGYSLDKLRRFESKHISFNGDTRHVFLEVLVDGIMNLYYYDYVNWAYFYLEKDGKLHLLDNSTGVVEIDGKSFNASSNSYIATMKVLMQEAFVMMDDIEATEFDHQSLVNTTREYHDLVCKDEVCTVYYNDRDYLDDRKWTITFGPSAGFAFSVFNMNSSLATMGKSIFKK